MEPLSRRHLLTLLGTTTLGTAGCSQLLEPNNNRQTETETEAQYPVKTSNVETSDFQYFPVAHGQNSQSSISLDVSDQNGLESVKLLLEYPEHGKQEKLTEKQVDSQQTDIESEFSDLLIGPGNNQFYLQVTDGKRKTKTLVAEHQADSKGYQLDLKKTKDGKAVGNLGNYNTERTWDNILFNLNGRTTDLIQQWHQNAVYNKAVEELGNNNHDKYNTEETGYGFSNGWYGNKEGGKGYWSLPRFKNLTDLDQILLDTQSAVQLHQAIVEDQEPSSWNGRFTATAEEIIDRFNKEAQKYRQETGETLANWGYVNEIGHGTAVVHVDIENSDIEAEHPWHFVDTTSGTKEPINQDLREYNWAIGDYNPFTMGYKPEKQTLGYDMEKKISDSALQSFVSHEQNTEEYNYNVSFNDEIHQHIFNNHVLEGGDIEPIENLGKMIIDAQIETEDYIVAVGNNPEVKENEYGEKVFDDIQFYAGDQELYQMSIDPQTQLTKEKAEKHLNQPAE